MLLDFSRTFAISVVVRKLLLYSFVILFASESCSKQNADAIDAMTVEGRWLVECIRYDGVLDDGTEVSAEPEHCDIFWTGDIIEFRSGSVYMGEKGTSFYSSFRGYPGSINYSIVDRQLFIPEQELLDYEEDTGGGWTVTLVASVGEWLLPYTLSDDIWIIRHENRGWFESEYGLFSCDFEIVLKREE